MNSKPCHWEDPCSSIFCLKYRNLDFVCCVMSGQCFFFPFLKGSDFYPTAYMTRTVGFEVTFLLISNGLLNSSPFIYLPWIVGPVTYPKFTLNAMRNVHYAIFLDLSPELLAWLTYQSHNARNSSFPVCATSWREPMRVCVQLLNVSELFLRLAF